MFKAVLRFFFSFRGRLSSFFYVVGFAATAPILLTYLHAVAALKDATLGVEYLNVFVLGLFLIWIGAALMVRRLHDIGVRGWWVFAVLAFIAMPYIPYAPVIAFTVLILTPGSNGANRFGPQPVRLRDVTVRTRLYFLNKKLKSGKITIDDFNARHKTIMAGKF